MKFSFTPLIILASSVLLAALAACTVTGTYNVDYYRPVYLSLEELRAEIKGYGATEIAESGKIYVDGNFIYINDKNKGIHVIDNMNPSSPGKVAWIPIPGNTDMVVQNGFLYANSYTDCVTLDVSDYNDISEVSRIEDIFPISQWMNGSSPGVYDSIEFLPVNKSKGIVIGWEYSHTETISYQYNYIPFVVDNTNSSSSGTPSFSGGGSLASFTLIDQYLYTLRSDDMLQIFSIDGTSNLLAPHSKVKVKQWGLETLFANDAGYLFIGSRTGMSIYDVTRPDTPAFISDFSHATSYDPVVMEGNAAYITLRSDSAGWGEDVLLIVDIEDIRNPQLIKEKPMQEPYGLGIRDGKLVICDGRAGLKLYSVDENYTLAIKDNFTEIKPYDVIMLPDAKALVVGSNTFIQFDLSNDVFTKISEFPLA